MDNDYGKENEVGTGDKKKDKFYDELKELERGLELAEALANAPEEQVGLMYEKYFNLVEKGKIQEVDSLVAYLRTAAKNASIDEFRGWGGRVNSQEVLAEIGFEPHGQNLDRDGADIVMTRDKIRDKAGEQLFGDGKKELLEIADGLTSIEMADSKAIKEIITDEIADTIERGPYNKDKGKDQNKELEGPELEFSK
ncbi:MAG: hypothetical protein HPY53_11195 [Brevinematales bacterium]|nr:hypothetical protein [Brevinematales bacterium]